MPNIQRQARPHKRPPWPAVAAGVLALLLAAGLRASLPLSPSLLPRLLHGHTAGVLALAFHPDGTTLASGSWDASIRLWDTFAALSAGTTPGAPLGAPLTGHTGGIPGLAFRPDGKTLLSAGQDRTLRLWDIATGSPIGPPLALPESADALAFHPDGALLAYSRCARWEKTWCTGGEAVLWDIASARPTGPPLAGHEGIVESLAFSPDGQTLASGSWDTTIRLWSTATGEPIGPPLEGHTNVVTCLAFSPDGQILASGAADRTVRLWDTFAALSAGAPTGRPIGPPLDGHTDIVMSVAFHPAGATLASGGYDGTVRLWDTFAALSAGTHTGLPLGPPLIAHAGAVTAVAFSPDGRILASGSGDTTIALWDLSARP